MEYSKIVSVTGLPGLYELISTKTDGAVVRSLDDKSTKFASSRIHHFSHLESIEVYTTGDNVNLVDVFKAMEKAGGSLPDTKDNSTVKKYFEKVYPEIDFDRVYNSDLKKMVKWFEVLRTNDIELKLSEPEAVEEEAEVEAPAPKEAEKKEPVRQEKAKKTAKKPAEKKEEKEAPAKPAKKTARKK